MCVTCERIVQRDSGTAPLWDAIYRSTYWDVVHAYNSGLLGWMVLVLRRHVTALDALTEAEAVGMGQLIWHLSRSLKQRTGCSKTYVVQFAEAAGHQHVHVIARMPEQPDTYKGPHIFNYLGVPAEQIIPEVAMNRLAALVQADLRAALG
jgi:diadenosine tetraphosphate (Ap4A) HIT family hydrolase